MLWTNSGYKRSVIFSLFANSKARSKGILIDQILLVVRSGMSLFLFGSTYQTPFKCIGPIFTTWRSFSLFKIPSRRPRVIPATFSNFVPLIIWLSVRYPCQIEGFQNWAYLPTSLTLSPCNAYTLGLHLITKTALVFPQSSSYSWFGSWWSNLAG